MSLNSGTEKSTEKGTTFEDKNQQLRRRHGSHGGESEKGSRRSSRSSTKSKTHKKPFVNFAPLNTPLQNRLETMGVIWHVLSIPFFVCLFLVAVSLGWVIWLFVVLPYFIWWYWFDLHTPTNGKTVYRVKDWMRNIIIWEWFVNYFPIIVHKSCELEPTFTEELVDGKVTLDDEEDLISEDSRTYIDKLFKIFGLMKRLNDSDSHQTIGPEGTRTGNGLKYKKVSTGPRYIFGYHPHGVISMGVMGTFATNIIRNEPYSPPFNFLKPFFHDPSKHAQLLPGIGNIFPLTLTTQFTLPFYRDYLMGLGLTSASYKNIKSLINNGDNSVCIVVGGAQESLLNNMVSPTYRIGNGYRKEISQEYEDETEPVVKEFNLRESEDINLKQGYKDVSTEPESGYGNGVHDNVDKISANFDNETEDEDAEEGKDGEDSNESAIIDNPKQKRQIQLVLNKRKGFVKLAIELGNTCLVPTFGFGEADIYRISQPKPGSLGSKFQSWMKSTFQFTVPFFSARGVFIYDFGLLPFRNPINICIGNPIYVPSGLIAEYKLKHPEFDSDEDEGKEKLNKHSKKGPRKIKIPSEILNHYHKLYVDELKRIYEENKSKFGYEDVELIIIE